MKAARFTPLATGLAAFAIVSLFIHRGVKASGDAASLQSDATHAASLPDTVSERSQPSARVAGRPSSEYRAAWDSLAARRLTQSERIELQRELFQLWAEVDLEAAITAALAEPWDEHSSGPAGLMTGQVMVDRCEEVWRLIENRHFGPLASHLVAEAWIASLAEKDPSSLYPYLAEMRDVTLHTAATNLFDRVRNKQQAIDTLRRTANARQWSDAELAGITKASTSMTFFFTTEELQAMLASESPAEARITSSLLAVKVLYELHRQQPVDIPAAIASVPETLRPGFATDILQKSDGSPTAVMAAVEVLVENEDWQALQLANGGAKVASITRATEPGELAAWVSGLPARPETKEMFHRGVAPLIQADREAALEWIAGLEEPEWRDRGFAEYSQQSLNHFRDPAASRAALDRIADPDFRREAESWRASWERRTGWTGP